MIDPHVHLRDWDQSKKETLLHGIGTAYRSGINGLFEMPNTSPVLTGRVVIERRIADAQKALEALSLSSEDLLYGLYVGLTQDKLQRAEVLGLYEEYFPTIIGFKLFAGHSTGNMGTTTEAAQRAIYRQLAETSYKGILAVHCEKETLMHPDLWDSSRPETHGEARPAVAELQSVKDQIAHAVETGFSGSLHICHVSHPDTVDLINEIRNTSLPFTITCGVTPHHALLNSEEVDHTGNLMKMNPPLRDKSAQERLYLQLLQGKIDWIESDHAPHTLQDKADGASGIPGFTGYVKLVPRLLSEKIDQELLKDLIGRRFLEVVGISVSDERFFSIPERFDPSIADDYPWDPFKYLLT